MNDDHCENIQQIKHVCAVDVDETRMVSLDRLGVEVQGILRDVNGEYVKARVPFTKKIGTRNGLKEEIMATSREAAKFVSNTKILQAFMYRGYSKVDRKVRGGV